METKQKRRSYTKEQRVAVLADVKELGVCEAARKHAVPQTTVSNWVTRAPRGKEATPSEGSASSPVTETPRAAPATPARRTMPSRVAKIYTPSQKALVLEDAAKDGVTTAAKKHGISLKCVRQL